jgi:lysophospholipase L1-like esterase
MSAEQVAQIPDTHAEYNRQVKQLATSLTNATVLDIEGDFAAQPALFRNDCIHLSESGHARCATLLAEHLKDLR